MFSTIKRSARESVEAESTANSALFDMMAQLDASRAESARREAESRSDRHREEDDGEVKMPIRLLQEISGNKIGFELPRTRLP